MPINPLYTRRILELSRNDGYFISKPEAMRAVYDKDFRGNLKDGEPIIVRYMVWYDLDTETNEYSQVLEPTISYSSYKFVNTLSVELGETTTRVYSSENDPDRNEADVVLKSNGDGTYTGYVCTAPVDPNDENHANAPVGTTIAENDYFNEIDATQYPLYTHISTCSAVIGITTIAGENWDDIKITFIEDEEEIKKLLEKQQSFSSPDGSIIINVTENGTELSINPVEVDLFDEGSIVIEDHFDDSVSPSVKDGRTVKLVIDGTDKVLSQTDVSQSGGTVTGGLKTTLTIEKFTKYDYDTTTPIPSDVSARYRLKGKGAATSLSSYLGNYIDVYNEGEIYQFYLGRYTDTVAPNPLVIWTDENENLIYTKDGVEANDTYYVLDGGSTFIIVEKGTVTSVAAGGDEIEVDGKTYTLVDKYTNQCVILDNTSTTESLNIVWANPDGTYSLYKINIETFINEEEVKNGLVITNHNLSARLKTNGGLEFDTTASDGQRPIQVSLPTSNGGSASATRYIGGVKVGVVNGGSVFGNTNTWENVDTNDDVTNNDDPENPRSNGTRRYSVNRDVNGIAYVTTPTAEIARWAVSEAWGNELANVDSILVRDSMGVLTTLNVWDCGEYE